MPITVADALALPELRRGVPEVVAGAARLDRPIRWVHAAEVPNIASLLKGGELLLMTGIGLPEGAREQEATAAALAAQGVAGVVLELGTTFPRPPAALARACAAHELPLVILHRPVRFVEVTETIHAAIVNRQFALMQRGEELHRRFTELMLHGAGIPEVLDALAEATGNPVRLLRPSGAVAAEALGGAARADAEAAWEAHAHALPDAPGSLARPVPSGDRERPLGTLVVLGLAAPVDDSSAVALERAVALVGLALAQGRADEALAHRERGALLEDLLHGGAGEADAAARAARLGFHAETMLPLAVARRAPRLGRLTEQEDARWALLWRELRGELEARRTPALLGGVGDQAVLVLGIGDAAERSAAATRAAELVRAASRRQLGSPAAAIVCAGRAVAGWRELGPAIEQALATLPAAGQLADRPWHDAAAPDVDRLLVELRGQPALRTFADARLEPVLAHDRERRSSLLPTLEAYCAHGGHKTATARALGIERPSLYHRLERLEQLLAAPLSDPDTLFALQLALRARRLVGT